MSLTLMEYSHTNIPKAPETVFLVCATFDDLQILRIWMDQYFKEIGVPPADDTFKLVSEEKVFVLKNITEDFLAMASITREIEEKTCISRVFVPEVLRGKGHGSICVSLLAERLRRRDSSKGICLLTEHADGGLYSRIGFISRGEYTLEEVE